MALVGCTSPEQPPLGPTGSSTNSLLEPGVRESYLIPPEIPASLLTYIFEHNARGREITSISVKDVAGNIWTLDITSESLPDSSLSETARFAPSGATWREL